MSKTKVMTAGLRELPQDDRDLQLGAVFSLPDVSQLPSSFVLEDTWIADQGTSDFCSAFSAIRASMLQEGVELSPEFSFALSKVISGDPEEWGQDLRTACKTLQKFGSLPKKDAPYSLANASPEDLRNIEFWGDLDPLLEKAEPYKKKTYLSAGTSFDEIRSAIYRFRNEKRAVIFGVIWDYAWTTSQLQMENVPTDGGGHAMTIIGWDGDYAIVKNQYPVAPAQGHRMHKRIIDHFVKKFGAFMFVDITPEEARKYQEAGVQKDKESILQFLVAFYKALLKKLHPDVGAVPSRWLKTAIAWKESELNPNAVGDKHLVNKAYGIFQIRLPFIKDVYAHRGAELSLIHI